MGDTVRGDDSHAFKRIAVILLFQNRKGAQNIVRRIIADVGGDGIQRIKVTPQPILDGVGRLLGQLF